MRHEEAPMATNLDLDPELLDRAVRSSDERFRTVVGRRAPERERGT